jgi:hypothetical protein
MQIRHSRRLAACKISLSKSFSNLNPFIFLIIYLLRNSANRPALSLLEAVMQSHMAAMHGTRNWQQPGAAQTADGTRIPATNPFADLIASIINPANAIRGDAVYTSEALDRVISQLMEQTQGSTAPPPAPQEAIDNLPTKPVDKEMLGEDGTAECSVCMETVELGELVGYLPCKHWFHKPCVTAWLTEHNTCPICRKGIGSTDGAQGGNGAGGNGGNPGAGAGGSDSSNNPSAPRRGWNIFSSSSNSNASSSAPPGANPGNQAATFTSDTSASPFFQTRHIVLPNSSIHITHHTIASPAFRRSASSNGGTSRPPMATIAIMRSVPPPSAPPGSGSPPSSSFFGRNNLRRSRSTNRAPGSSDGPSRNIRRRTSIWSNPSASPNSNETGPGPEVYIPPLGDLHAQYVDDLQHRQEREDRPRAAVAGGNDHSEDSAGSSSGLRNTVRGWFGRH